MWVNNNPIHCILYRPIVNQSSIHISATNQQKWYARNDIHTLISYLSLLCNVAYTCELRIARSIWTHTSMGHTHTWWMTEWMNELTFIWGVWWSAITWHRLKWPISSFNAHCVCDTPSPLPSHGQPSMRRAGCLIEQRTNSININKPILYHIVNQSIYSRLL